MKIGLVTDIDNHAVHLRGTLKILEHEQVDQIVIIGDTFEPLADPEESSKVAELLLAHRTLGVWWNQARLVASY
jgi:predicted phosphodiesterase